MLTPRAYRALADRHADREKRRDARFGVLASVIANSQGGKQGGGSFQPADFFPSLMDAPASERPSSRATDEQVAAGWSAWMAMCGARAG